VRGQAGDGYSTTRGGVRIHAFAEAILGGIASYAGTPRGYSEGMVRSIFKKPHPEIDMPKLVDATLQTPTSTGIAMLVTDIFGADRRPALAKLTRPSLVIASSESPLLDVQREMAATMPGARFVVVDGAGHAVMVDAPDRFDALLQSFLAQLT
jgi:non-heme chloroperoxidase